MAIHPYYEENEEDFDATQAFSIPEYPELRTLELHRMDCGEFVANFDFTRLPALETISLMSCASPMSLLRLLLQSQDKANGEDRIWPQLRKIQITGPFDVEDFVVLYEILSHREAGGKPIQPESVHINGLPMPDILS